jgi:hypothetical protein
MSTRRSASSFFCLARGFSLIIALEKGHLEMAKLLLLRGADVKLQHSGYHSRRCAPARSALSQMLQCPCCAAAGLLCTGLHLRASTIWSGCFWRMTPQQKA